MVERARAAGPYAAVAGAATGAFLLLYRPWGWRFGVPWSYGFDNFALAMFVKSQQLGGGYGEAPSLGAPFGQEMYDFPQGGNRIHLGAWRLIGLVVDDPFTVLNIWFALGFPLIAVVAYWVLRRLSVHSWIAGGLAVAYAFLPYRFWHGLQHLALATYFAIPLVVLLAVWVTTDQVPVRPRGRDGWTPRAVRRRWIGIGLMAIAIGASDPYYVTFGALLIGSAGLFEVLRRRSLAPAFASVAVIAAIGAVMAVCLLPEIAFRAENGANDRVSERLLMDSETYALHLTQVVTPSPDHRVASLATIGRKASQVALPGEGGTAIGILGVAGLVIGGGALLGLRSAGSSDEQLLLKRLGSLQVAMALVGTVGGIGFLLAVFGMTQIRSWGRVAVVLAFLALVALGVALTGLARRHLSARARDRKVVALVGVLLAVIGVLDGTPGNVRPNYEHARAVREVDRAFVAEMEAALPEGAAVFQLPVVPFPETPLVGMGSYDHVRPYVLGSDRLRWSFGGLKGRVHDWQEVWALEPIDRQLDGLVAAGFDALYIDTFGYPEDDVEDVEDVLGPPTGTSADERQRWYDLRPLGAAVRARLGDEAFAALGQAVTTLVRVEVGLGFSAHEETDDGPARWLGASGELAMPNFGDDGREVVLRLEVVGPAGSTLTVEGPGDPVAVELSGRRMVVEATLRLAAGPNTIEVRSDAPPNVDANGLDRRVAVLDVTLGDAVVERLLD